ncbi:hypothetical protein OHA18_05210 [Kribbella sp. NBC_00709]|uniref:RICIN domain-containing protein n=1 Tax=Kribbella sp. NBC_00709 TaxID=2975972 RepID=UPI002E27D905|nr:hypothetical protein [Kribbella sp. NBC_00709]
MGKLKGAVLAGVAASALVATAAPAQASTYEGIQTFKFEDSNSMCISDLSEGLGPAKCVGTNYQKWGVYAAPNVRAFKNVQTGRCIQGGWDARVVSVVCQGSDYQRFNILHNDDGSIELKNVATGNCITFAPGKALYLSRCVKNEPWQSLV